MYGRGGGEACWRMIEGGDGGSDGDDGDGDDDDMMMMLMDGNGYQ